MDALALLCNLYGDGPATLRRLREAGYGDLADVARCSLDELALILGGSPAAARRFQHEAELLGARTLAAGSSEIREAAPPPPSPREAVLERALAAWRAADAAAIDAPEEPAADEAGDPVPDDSRDGAADAAVGGTPLRPGLIEGLDEGVCVRLRAAGIDQVEELLTAELLDLSNACEIPLTRLLRIQGHLRRSLALDTQGLLVPRPRRSEARFSPDPRAVELRERAREELEPGSGPFA